MEKCREGEGSLFFRAERFEARRVFSRSVPVLRLENQGCSICRLECSWEHLGYHPVSVKGKSVQKDTHAIAPPDNEGELTGRVDRVLARSGERRGDSTAPRIRPNPRQTPRRCGSQSERGRQSTLEFFSSILSSGHIQSLH